VDKKLILAVAGSGKTYYIVNQIQEDKRYLIITYTETSKNNLQKCIIERFKGFPNNITLETYFTFLYSFCIQPFLADKYKLNGLLFDSNKDRYATNDRRYLTNSKRLFYNRAAKFTEYSGIHDKIIERLENYYQYLCIDEIQDFAGHDFNLLENITKANINYLFVGDYFQHTFDTSRDGNVNQNLHDNFEKYKNRFKKMNFYIDPTMLIKSWRCSPTVCNYIRDNLKIDIKSHKETNVQIRYITDKKEIKKIIENNEIIKLFYENHNKYRCWSKNWGKCKSENDYIDVCVVLNNNTLRLFNKNKLYELARITLNKLYVAISRANRNVYFIAEKDIKDYKSENER
jgi:DNA helicase II / ATP-dependent DNA helicase PcrA